MLVQLQTASQSNWQPGHDSEFPAWLASLEILGLVAGHDQVVLDEMTTGPRNATNTSPEIQISILQIMGA